MTSFGGFCFGFVLLFWFCLFGWLALLFNSLRVITSLAKRPNLKVLTSIIFSPPSPPGSFATASCLICKYKVDCEVVRGDIFNQVKTYFKSLQLSNSNLITKQSIA